MPPCLEGGKPGPLPKPRPDPLESEEERGPKGEAQGDGFDPKPLAVHTVQGVKKTSR